MILSIASIIVLAFFIAIELQTAVVLAMSARALRRAKRVTAYGRTQDMLQSDSSPPVSLVVPAYNEAAGIVDSIRSRTILGYPRFEIVVVNDGSTDDTLQALIEAFDLRRVDIPIRPQLKHAPIRALYQSTLPINLTVVDKENGGKGDALNAGINAARYPYVLVTDADMIFEEDSLLHSMRPFVEDRHRTVAVGGNIRPLNGCQVAHGRVEEPGLPTSLTEMVQVVEYQRSFLAARPGWSEFNGLLLVSGAYGVFRKSALIECGGFPEHHLGEDFDVTMRLHRSQRDAGSDYRIVYEPDAVVWTEVPTKRSVLRKQRIRWHRGLLQVVSDHKSMLLRPRYGVVGMAAWPAFFLFEYLAPIVEFLGWIIIPLALIFGFLNFSVFIWLLVIAFLLGILNSIGALTLDEQFGHFNSPRQALALLLVAIIENFGPRQQTVWWRVRAMFWRRGQSEWGDMERSGVSNIG